MTTTRGTRYFQMAWVVDDLEAAVRRWVESSNVGPFYVIAHAKVERVRYRGVPAQLDFSGALAQAGDIQIELIQQHNDGPSAYRDVFPKGAQGFHHMCTFVDDFDAEIARYAARGAVAAVDGAFGDMRFAYLDTRADLGHMTEIIEDRASIRDVFKIVADAAADWDGRDPIRYL